MTTRVYIKRPFPARTLEAALQIPRAIQDANNGQPMNQALLAQAIKRTHGSSEFKLLLGSSLKYGLTAGNEKSSVIALGPLGESVVKPRDSSEYANALKTAALQPELFRRIYEYYNDGKLPQGAFFYNVLERNFSVPRDRCAECADLLVQNGQYAGIVEERKGVLYVRLGPQAIGGPQLDEIPVEEGEAAEGESELPSAPLVDRQPVGERYIFVAHGKNRKPLEQLEKVLKQFGIPYKVAVEEPQMARPISVKVAQTMRDCHSAILIFTGDEEYKTLDDQTVRRPSENVIYELGAASILYDNRIVVFKEDSLDFPTDFRDIGYISFEKDRLDAKGVELIQELIALGLIKVQPA